MAEQGRIYRWARNRSLGDAKARPVIVIALDAATAVLERWVVVPISSDPRLEAHPLAVPLSPQEGSGLERTSFAMSWFAMSWLPTTVLRQELQGPIGRSAPEVVRQVLLTMARALDLSMQEAWSEAGAKLERRLRQEQRTPEAGAKTVYRDATGRGCEGRADCRNPGRPPEPGRIESTGSRGGKQHISRVLFTATGPGGLVAGVTICLGPPLPAASSGTGERNGNDGQPLFRGPKPWPCSRPGFTEPAPLDAAGALLPHPCTLTCAAGGPRPVDRHRRCVSVALSSRSPAPGVIRQAWPSGSPDFPQPAGAPLDRSPGNAPPIAITSAAFQGSDYPAGPRPMPAGADVLEFRPAMAIGWPAWGCSSAG